MLAARRASAVEGGQASDSAVQDVAGVTPSEDTGGTALGPAADAGDEERREWEASVALARQPWRTTPASAALQRRLKEMVALRESMAEAISALMAEAGGSESGHK